MVTKNKDNICNAACIVAMRQVLHIKLQVANIARASLTLYKAAFYLNRTTYKICINIVQDAYLQYIHWRW